MAAKKISVKLILVKVDGSGNDIITEKDLVPTLAQAKIDPAALLYVMSRGVADSENEPILRAVGIRNIFTENFLSRLSVFKTVTVTYDHENEDSVYYATPSDILLKLRAAESVVDLAKTFKTACEKARSDVGYKTDPVVKIAKATTQSATPSVPAGLASAIDALLSD